MAKAFIYSFNSLYDTAPADGYITLGPPHAFATGDKVTNEERVTDQSTGSAISGFDTTGNGGASEDAIRLDLGSSQAVTSLAVHIAATDADDLDVYAADSATVPEPTAIQEWASLDAGWNVVTIAATKRYWFFQSATGILIPTEFLVGTVYSFGSDPALDGNDFGETSGSDIVKSYGGIEYSNKRHALRSHWSLAWTRDAPVDETMKDALVTFRDAVEIDRLKFLYYDESSYHWVRMTKNSLKFKRIAYQLYTTNIEMIEQLQ